MVYHKSYSLSPAFFYNFFAEELRNAKENPAAAAGIGLAAGLVLMRGITFAFEASENYQIFISEICLV